MNQTWKTKKKQTKDKAEAKGRLQKVVFVFRKNRCYGLFIDKTCLGLVESYFRQNALCVNGPFISIFSQHLICYECIARGLDRRVEQGRKISLT